MTVTQRLMKPGNWSLRFKDNTPRSIFSKPNWFDYIVVTPTRRDPVTAFSDANILDSALYVGVFHSRPDPLTMEGAGLDYLLGTPDGAGELIPAKYTSTSSTTMSTAITAAWALSAFHSAGVKNIKLGTLTNTGLPFVGDRVFPAWITPREWVDALCLAVGAEWRVTNRAKIDVAAPATLFATTPAVIVTRNPSGREGAFEGLTATSMVASSDVQQYANAIVRISQSGAPAAQADVAPYSNFDGDAFIDMTRVIDTKTESDAAADTIAANTLIDLMAVRTNIALSSRTYAIDRNVKAGDYVYVWDQKAGLFDAANPVQYRGEVIKPVKLRVYALTWPLEAGMGVYLRTAGGGAGAYTDLSDHIDWDSGDVTWEVGAADKTVTNNTSYTGATAYLGANPLAVERANNTTTWTAVSFQNSWANFGAGDQVAQYRRILGEMVQVRGLIKTGASGTTAFTLPTGFRPPDRVSFPVRGPGGTTTATAIVDTAGGVTIISPSGTTDVGCCFEFSTTA